MNISKTFLFLSSEPEKLEGRPEATFANRIRMQRAAPGTAVPNPKCIRVTK